MPFFPLPTPLTTVKWKKDAYAPCIENTSEYQCKLSCQKRTIGWIDSKCPLMINCHKRMTGWNRRATCNPHATFYHIVESFRIIMDTSSSLWFVCNGRLKLKRKCCTRMRDLHLILWCGGSFNKSKHPMGAAMFSCLQAMAMLPLA